MESTPSMACANKCTFCWRLNSNPTATSWRWDIDDPKEVVAGMIAGHQALVKNAKGMPGVTPKSFSEAMEPRHCALSLVGEPILYPKINEFLGLLHQHNISTFLVNNGQFPEQLEKLPPVTQLYLSVDAPSREKMKELDRPAFPDFWDRFNESVQLCARRHERTVFRLTMIDGHNMASTDIPLYVDIFSRGKPHFIELKALTPAFQGSSDKSKTFLRITNVPSFSRVLGFAAELVAHLGGEYEISCTHEHSNCVLLAQRRFRSACGWNTWIDFDKFSLLTKRSDFLKPGSFSPEDYLLPTPEWALVGSLEQGFDPQQTRNITAKRRAHMAREAAPPIPSE